MAGAGTEAVDAAVGGGGGGGEAMEVDGGTSAAGVDARDRLPDPPQADPRQPPPQDARA